MRIAQIFSDRGCCS